MDSLTITFQHNLEGEYIKAKEIIQNKNGDMFLCPYLNNGVFYLLIFDKEKVIKDLNVNDLVNSDQSYEGELDDRTRPNDNFPDPFINACFIKNK